MRIFETESTADRTNSLNVICTQKEKQLKCVTRCLGVYEDVYKMFYIVSCEVC